MKKKRRNKVPIKIQGILNYWLELTLLLVRFAPDTMFFASVFITVSKLDPY